MIQTALQTNSIQKFINRASVKNQIIKDRHLSLLSSSIFLRDDGVKDHFCVYFAGIDVAKKKVFLGHHKKANMWIFNGCHLDKNETIEESLFREIEEEWGVPVQRQFINDHYRLSITPIDNTKQPTCLNHYDLWHFVHLDSSEFKPDQKKVKTEFHEMRWLTLQEVKKNVRDLNTKETIEWLFLKTDSNNLVQTRL